MTTDQQTPETDEPSIPLTPFVAQLMEHSIKESQSVTNRLIDSLTYDRDSWRARCELIQEKIHALYAGPWQPAERFVLAALLPPEHLVEERIRENREVSR